MENSAPAILGGVLFGGVVFGLVAAGLGGGLLSVASYTILGVLVGGFVGFVLHTWLEWKNGSGGEM